MLKKKNPFLDVATVGPPNLWYDVLVVSDSFRKDFVWKMFLEMVVCLRDDRKSECWLKGQYSQKMCGGITIDFEWKWCCCPAAAAGKIECRKLVKRLLSPLSRLSEMPLVACNPGIWRWWFIQKKSSLGYTTCCRGWALRERGNAADWPINRKTIPPLCCW